MADKKKGAPPPEKKMVPGYMNFALGGAAGITSASIVHPLDVIKMRMQVLGKGGASKPSFVGTVSHVMKTDGIKGLYRGWQAAVLRQATYGSTRLGAYTFMYERMTVNGVPPNFGKKFVIAMVSGLAAGFVGNPAEVVMIRMALDSTAPPAERRNYKNLFNALGRIAKEEGPATLLRGVVPTMARASFGNIAQLTTYSQSKQYLISTGMFVEGLFLQFCSSMLAGIATALAAVPPDVVKTRMQNMKTVDGKPEYSGPLDVIFKAIKNEGPFALWKGLTPFYLRMGPHTVFTLMFLEQYTTYYKKFAGIN